MCIRDGLHAARAAVARPAHRRAGSVQPFGWLLRPRVFAPALVSAAVAIGLLQVLSGPDGRRLYAAVASYHAYLEYPLLVLLAASLVRRRTSSGRNRS